MSVSAPFPIFFINLARRPDRRRYMEAQLAALGLVGTRIEAVTPADLTAEDIERYCNTERPSFLRQNELSCTLSHEKAWRMMIEGGHERALILEDDAELSDMLPAFLAEAGSIDADMIRIETTGAAMRIFPLVSTGPSGISVHPFRSTPMGTAGYVIRADAARRILGHPDLRYRHLDLALFNPFMEPGSLLKRVMTNPALCRQLGVNDQRTAEVGHSDIANTDIPHQYALKHPIRARSRKAWRTLKSSLRNVSDHFAQRSKGLERKVIPFGGTPAEP